MCLASLGSVQKVVGPSGDPRSKGQPWQRPAGRPTRGDPDLCPPPAVASGLASVHGHGDPVLHQPAVQPGVTLSAAAAKCYAAARVSPAFSLPIISTGKKFAAATRGKEDKKSHPTTPPPPPTKAVAGDPVPGRQPTDPAATCLQEGPNPAPETWDQPP